MMQNLGHVSHGREYEQYSVSFLAQEMEDHFDRFNTTVEVVSNYELALPASTEIPFDDPNSVKLTYSSIQKRISLKSTDTKKLLEYQTVYRLNNNTCIVSVDGTDVFTGHLTEAAEKVYEICLINAKALAMLTPHSSPLHMRTLREISQDMSLPGEISQIADLCCGVIEPTSLCFLEMEPFSCKFILKDPTVDGKKLKCTMNFIRNREGLYEILYLDRKYGHETRTHIYPMKDLQKAIRDFKIEIKAHDKWDN